MLDEELAAVLKARACREHQRRDGAWPAMVARRGRVSSGEVTQRLLGRVRRLRVVGRVGRGPQHQAPPTRGNLTRARFRGPFGSGHGQLSGHEGFWPEGAEIRAKQQLVCFWLPCLLCGAPFRLHEVVLMAVPTDGRHWNGFFSFGFDGFLFWVSFEGH